jgi:polysaccharide deacetylase family protein (PEP-CTERM system associated)
VIKNALTFDIEDWHQLVEWKVNGRLGPSSGHVVVQTHDILEILAERGVRATFFVLGLVVEAHPELVRAIAAAGHEIGCHGSSHQLIYRQTRLAFADETRRSKAALEDVLGQPVRGYRAAEFSITAASRWALEVLAETGFTYDSSIFPIRGRRYGIPDTPLAPHRVSTAAGDLIEVPLTAVDKGGRRWPVGGGGYFRLMPYGLTRTAIEQVNAAGRSAIIYFHPYEFSASPLVPRLASPASYLSGARYVVFHNVNRRRNRRRFLRLLGDFRLVPIADLINHG